MIDATAVAVLLADDLDRVAPGHAEARLAEPVRPYDRPRLHAQLTKRMAERGLVVTYLTTVELTAGGSLIMATCRRA